MGISMFTVIQLLYYVVVGLVENYEKWFKRFKSSINIKFHNRDNLKDKDNPMELY